MKNQIKMIRDIDIDQLYHQGKIYSLIFQSFPYPTNRKRSDLIVVVGKPMNKNALFVDLEMPVLTNYGWRRKLVYKFNRFFKRKHNDGEA
jgi:hypothetical protein